MSQAKPKFSPEDAKWMSLALAEAAKARGRTSPNPIVGAVLVRGGKLLAKGHHRRAGLPHAEIEALKRAKDPRGATLYVTLEPCCHEGKRTPPCTTAILASGLRRVVVGTLDPNPQVSGRGVSRLRRAGIRVEVGSLAEDCAALNPFFNHWIVRRRPYVILKAAASLDGKIALANGSSQWITGEAARRRVHEWRAEVDAVVAGVGTILADDPQLNARFPKAAKQPIRIVLDPQARTPLAARVLRVGEAPCWIVVASGTEKGKKARALAKRGAELIVCPLRGKGFDMGRLLKIFGARNLSSLLVEGGAATWTAFLKAKAFQEIRLFLGPLLLGAEARPLLGPLGLSALKRAPRLKLGGFERFGDDSLLRLFP